MFRVAVGFIIGYLLGSRAGRERYDQIMRWVSRAADSPAIQGAAGFVQAKVSGLLRGNKRKQERPDLAYLDPEPVSTEQAPWTARESTATV
jgi:hypothetical protein